jgi:crotonobetainyl-CoA:carnitine CoA-transferase CaiB-like acyl-CoA transferase
VDAPVSYDGAQRHRAAGPPRAGQHTREILGELGYRPDDIDALQAGQEDQEDQAR